MAYALLFPGQGAQSPGMGRALYDAFQDSRDAFDEADEALGYSIRKICFEGSDDDLALTENTQPAILTVSVAALRALRRAGVPEPVAAAGHSLGEYSAHVAADTLEFASAVATVRRRGRFMQEAVPVGAGAMAAILGLDLEVLERLCREQAGDEVVSPANLNAPGQVVVAGADITGLNEHERTLFRRRRIGFVYQSFNLVPTLTVADNVRLVLELNDVPAGDAQARIDRLLDAVGLADRADSYPDILSGGEQQRVAIARALSHGPAVLLADEPTGNLDDATAELVLDLLDDLVRRSGGTMLIATHSETVASMCDRVLELHTGKLEERA